MVLVERVQLGAKHTKLGRTISSFSAFWPCRTFLARTVYIKHPLHSDIIRYHHQASRNNHILDENCTVSQAVPPSFMANSDHHDPSVLSFDGIRIPFMTPTTNSTYPFRHLYKLTYQEKQEEIATATIRCSPNDFLYIVSSTDPQTTNRMACLASLKWGGIQELYECVFESDEEKFDDFKLNREARS